MKKIAFVGTSCTGKTTLLNEFKKTHPEAAFVDEVAREFFQTNPIPEEARFTLDVQGQIQQIIQRNEHAVLAQSPRFIFCDRSVLDAAVIVSANGDKPGGIILLDRVRGWLSTYHKVYLLDPADIPYIKDEIRIESAASRMNMHNGFVEFFEENNLPFELLSGTIDERKQRVAVALS